MAILVKSGTLSSEKNRWSTTWPCFDDAVSLYGKPFQLDVAAEPETRKVNRFMVSPDWMAAAKKQKNGLALVKSENYEIAAINALVNDWVDSWWCNPPFDLKVEFLEKAFEQVSKGFGGMMLLPYEPLTDWWRDWVSPIATAVYEPDGRYPFYEIDGKTQKSGVNFGSVFVLFTPEFNDGTLPRYNFQKLRLNRSIKIRPKQIENLRIKHIG